MESEPLLLFTATVKRRDGSYSSGGVTVGRTEEEARENIRRDPSDVITLYRADDRPDFWKHLIRPGSIQYIKGLEHHKHFDEMQRLEAEAVAVWEAAGARLRELFSQPN